MPPRKGPPRDPGGFTVDFPSWDARRKFTDFQEKLGTRSYQATCRAAFAATEHILDAQLAGKKVVIIDADGTQTELPPIKLT